MSQIKKLIFADLLNTKDYPLFTFHFPLKWSPAEFAEFRRNNPSGFLALPGNKSTFPWKGKELFVHLILTTDNPQPASGRQAYNPLRLSTFHFPLPPTTCSGKLLCPLFSTHNLSPAGRPTTRSDFPLSTVLCPLSSVHYFQNFPQI